MYLQSTNMVLMQFGFCLVILIHVAVSDSTEFELKTRTVDYRRYSGCIDLEQVSSICPDKETLQNNCPVPVVLDKCGYCYTCPAYMEGDTCGGPYYIYGVCGKKHPNCKVVKKDLYCTTDDKQPLAKYDAIIMRGVNLTGICKRKYCLHPNS